MAASSSRIRLGGVCLALFLGTVLIFGRAIGNDFVNYDDPDYVTKNTHVQAGLNGPDLRWAFTSGEASNWHPVTWISHLVDWSLFGSDPRGHHATSVFWHALNAVLVFLVFRRLTGSFGMSAFGAALFAWHPLRVESVAWVAERKDVLSGFFALLTLWFYAGYAERRRRQTAAKRRYAAALAAFALGLMAKPMLVALPGVLLLLDFWPLRRFSPAADSQGKGAGLWLEKIPFFILSAASCAVTYLVQKNSGAVSLGLGFGARLANAVVSVVRYLGKFLWPFDLAALYPHPGAWPGGAVTGAAFLIAAITGGALWQRRRRPWLIVGWLWFVGTLLPVLGLVQVGVQSMADRYTYLPILGVELGLLWTMRSAVTTPGRRRIAAALAASILAGCAALTWRQIGWWRNSGTLFQHALAVTKNNYMAYNNLGVFEEDRGRIDDALADFQRAVAIHPNFDDANNNLGHLLEKNGHPVEALVYLRRAVAANPGLLEARVNLGNALSDVGQLDEALREDRYVLDRQPENEGALNNAGVVLAMQGKLEEAVQSVTQALRLQPDDAGAHGNLGNILAMAGKLDGAIDEYRRALALAPNEASTYNNLGNVLRQKNRFAEAADQYERAVRLRPFNPGAHASLGLVLAQLGRRDEAIGQLQVSLQQQPGNAQVQALLRTVSALPATTEEK